MRKLLLFLFALLMLAGVAQASALPHAIDADLLTANLPGYTFVDGVDTGDTLRLLMRSPEGELTFIGGVKNASGQWTLTRSTPLPEGTIMDTAQAPYALSLTVRANALRIELLPYADGTWGVSSIVPAAAPRKSFNLRKHRIYTSHILGEDALLGDHPWSDIAVIDWTSLPASHDEAVAALDTSHWAVISSPDPLDLVRLREDPSQDARSLGSYYNGTAVYIREYGKAWCAVTIGETEGWIMTDFLASAGSFGSVPSASPIAVPRKLEIQLHISPSRRSAYVLREMEYPDSPHILGKSGYWYHVWLPDTEEYGYVHADDI